jgi:hypothetical protein
MINNANHKFNRIYGNKTPILTGGTVKFERNYPDKCSKEWMIIQNHKLVERCRQEKRDKLNAKNRITTDLDNIIFIIDEFSNSVIEEEIDQELINLAQLSTKLKYDLHDLINMLRFYNNEDCETVLIKECHVDTLENQINNLLNHMGNILTDIGVQRNLEGQRRAIVGGKIDENLIDIEWSLGMFINQMRNAVKN